MGLNSVRKTFTGWAPVYDASHGWLPRRSEARLALGVQPGDRVLDLATGTGLNLPQLRELVGDEGRVTGVDLTPAMLEIARTNIARHGWKNVEVREADAAQLPFPDASFDKAICTFALNIIPDYGRAIEEASRVLVAGGRFVTLDMEAMLPGLPRWLQPMSHICAVNISHRVLDQLRRVFPNTRVRRYWPGMIFVAVSTNE